MPTEKNEESSQNKQVFRHWVEVRDLKTGSVRQLPLTTVVSISLAPKKLEPESPRRELLHLADGHAIMEAKDLDDLAAQLRQKYPDNAYVRTLHRQRDPEAEKRRADAINKLSELLLPHAYLEALYVIQAELKRAEPEPKVPDTELEREAARRGIATIDTGKWKQRDTWIHLPPSWVRQILEMFASGKWSDGAFSQKSHASTLPGQTTSTSQVLVGQAARSRNLHIVKRRGSESERVLDDGCTRLLVGGAGRKVSVAVRVQKSKHVVAYLLPRQRLFGTTIELKN